MSSNKKRHVFDIGPIRPPSESNSLLLRVTENCPWNRCKFCGLYKQSSFKTRKYEDIISDIDEMAYFRDLILNHKRDYGFDMEAIYNEYDSISSHSEKYCYNMVFNWLNVSGSSSIFLQDANTLVLSNSKLVPILKHIRKKLPEIKRVTSYGRADTLSQKSESDYIELKEAGLDRIHSGFESGSDEVLKRIGKGSSQSMQIDAGSKIKHSGIELSIYFMPGVGGRELSDENAYETAYVINKINPSFVRLRTFVVKEGTQMWLDRQKGVFKELTDIEKLNEIRLLISQIDDCDGYLASDQIINLLENVKGSLKTDIPNIIRYIDEFLALNRHEQRRYQIARRMGFNGDWKNINRLGDYDLKTVDDYCKKVSDGPEWEELLNKYLRLYI